MKAIGRRRRAWVTSTPGKLTLPAAGAYTSAKILISVDLPAPFSPRSARISPALRAMPTSVSASVPPKLLKTPRTCNSSLASVACGRSLVERFAPTAPSPASIDSILREAFRPGRLAPALAPGLRQRGRTDPDLRERPFWPRRAVGGALRAYALVR